MGHFQKDRRSNIEVDEYIGTSMRNKYINSVTSLLVMISVQNFSGEMRVSRKIVSIVI